MNTIDSALCRQVSGGTKASDTLTGALLGAGIGAGLVLSLATANNYVAPISLIFLQPAVMIGGVIGATAGFINAHEPANVMNGHYY